MSGLLAVCAKIVVVPPDSEKERRWRGKLDQVQRDIWADHEGNLPPRLYHYSSASGIRGILKSKEIWLSDIRCMNDARDGAYWLEVFRPIFLRKSVPEYVRDVFRSGSLGLRTLWNDYICCFSPKSDLDNQWCRYGDHGEGCAIEDIHRRVDRLR